VGPGLIFRRFTDTNVKGPVPLKCGKLATKCPWIYGYFYSLSRRDCHTVAHTSTNVLIWHFRPGVVTYFSDFQYDWAENWTRRVDFIIVTHMCVKTDEHHRRANSRRLTRLPYSAVALRLIGRCGFVISRTERALCSVDSVAQSPRTMDRSAAFNLRLNLHFIDSHLNFTATDWTKSSADAEIAQHVSRRMPPKSKTPYIPISVPPLVFLSTIQNHRTLRSGSALVCHGTLTYPVF